MIEDKFNLNNVSLTGDEERQHSGLYTFEGQEYKRASAVSANNAISTGHDNIDFVDIGQRERRQIISYDIDKYYRDTLSAPTGDKGGKDKKKLKGWRSFTNGGYDHMFFDAAKLDALEEKEKAWLSFT